MNILPIIQDPSFMQQTDAAINTFCKEVQEITYIDHGADNIVALVNRDYVFRFPRNQDAAKRLYLETAVLQKTRGKLTAVSVPELAEIHHQPFYTVAKYIAGEHLTAREIKELSEAEQADIGKRVAEFVAQMNQSISGLEIRRLRTESGVDHLRETWHDYFERLFVKNRLPNDKLRPFVDEFYPLWKDYQQHEERDHAIHDDLHPDNLLFIGPKLNGIVDFGETNTGSIEEEMRWLYLMGDNVLRPAINHYQSLTNNQVNYDHIRVWVIMHELATFTSRLAQQQTESTPFLRAQNHLRGWIPNFPL